METEVSPSSAAPDVQSASALIPVPAGALVVPAIDEVSAAERVRLSVIVPTFNESPNVRPLVELLSGLLAEPLQGSYEIIIVDDDSPDQTWRVAQELTAQFPALRVMRRVGEKGLSSAVIRGWQVARGENLAVIDGDLQHPPETLLQLWRTLSSENADLVVASRHVEGGGVSDWSIIRRFLSRGAQVLGFLLLPKVLGRVSDPMSGYFMFSRKSIAGVELNPIGYKILLEVIGRGRMERIREVGYVFKERSAGESKVTWHLYLQYLLHLLRLRLATWPVARFIRFGVVGFSGVFVDMGFLFLLSDPSMLAWGLTRSKAIAAELAIINNFLWNDAWTFRDKAGTQRRFSQKLHRLMKFNVICGIGLVLNVVLLNVMFNFLHLNRYLANAIAIVIVTFWNFWLNMKLNWRVAEAGPSQK